jgi:outer membrane protein assembly factor BamE (lipoprotein component of BamABCDE complex)
MKMKFLLFALAALFLAGCIDVVTPSTQINKVHLGMSEAEVIKILGQPVSKAENKDGSTTLYYTLREIWGSINAAPYSVKLVNGKVDSYGRDAGQRTSEPMPVIVPVVH